MNIANLQKLLLEAKKLSNHKEFVILGSLATLGLKVKPPERMVMSIDIDLYLKNDPARTETLTKALGEGSFFDIENGFYLDSVDPKMPSFPNGWENRLNSINLEDGIVAYFVNINDVAVSKYIRGEERDVEWIRAGIKANIIDLSVIKNTISSANVLDGELVKAMEMIIEDEVWLKSFQQSNKFKSNL